MQITSELYEKTTPFHCKWDIDITAEESYLSFSNKPSYGVCLLVLVFCKDDTVY